jgi:oligopeptidase B
MDHLPTPPKARPRPTTVRIHGDERVDEFAWLRRRDDPEVLAYLQAENRYAESVMRSTARLQETLVREIAARTTPSDVSVPARSGDYLYYQRTRAGSRYRIHCRRRAVPEGPEEVLLDENEVAAGHDYFRLGAFSWSPDHRYLAYSVDTTGDERFAIHVKALDRGDVLDDVVPGVSSGIEWANDGRTFFYLVPDGSGRPHRLYRHTIGSRADTDAIVREERDPAFHLSVDRTRSGRFLVLLSASLTSTEVRYLAADSPDGEFALVEPRRRGIGYWVTHRDDAFIIRTNDRAPNFRIVAAPVADPSRANWREIVPHRPDVQIEHVDAFRRHLVLVERCDGVRRLKIVQPSTGTRHHVALPEAVHNLWPGPNLEFDTNVLRFLYTSPVTPTSIFDYDMDRRRLVLRKQGDVLGGYDPSRYRTERLTARAPDGALVPISLLRRADLSLDGANPLVLSGYGAYGACMEFSFSPARLSLLDRGVIVAAAHVRGGGEKGVPWREAGKLLDKKNSVSDFIACAEHLIAAGYTSPERLAAAGGSAGGLLVGAVVNMRPDLFRAAVAPLPFVDVLGALLDDALPLSVFEREEWGDPRTAEAYEYIKSYAPYDNVGAGPYPALLVTAALDDPRVPYWQPAAWAARMRARRRDDGLLVLRTRIGGGHRGPSTQDDVLRETAFEYAFLLDRLVQRPIERP